MNSRHRFESPWRVGKLDKVRRFYASDLSWALPCLVLHSFHVMSCHVKCNARKGKAQDKSGGGVVVFGMVRYSKSRESAPSNLRERIIRTFLYSRWEVCVSSESVLNADMKIGVCLRTCVLRWADIGCPSSGSNLRHWTFTWIVGCICSIKHLNFLTL